MKETKKDQLRHVYWIGGGSGAGKSTVARHLADKHNFYVYATDEVISEHVHKSTQETCPYLFQFKEMSMDERWVERSPKEMLDTFHWFHGEGFSFIIEDLLSLPKDRNIVVEGFRLLPRLVQPYLFRASQAVWLLPTPDFRARVFESRGGVAWNFLSKTGNPEKALSNLLARDGMFTEKLREEIRENFLHAIEVDCMISEEALLMHIMTMYGLCSADERFFVKS